MKLILRFTLFLSLVVTSGCFGILGSNDDEAYPNTEKKNFTVKATLTDGYKAVFGVNDTDKVCDTHFRGSVKLKAGVNKIGLKTGQQTYIVVAVYRIDYRGDTTVKNGALITPHKNALYEVHVNYVDSMYDLRFYQKTKRGKKEIALIPLSACKPT